jgi:hypothetical protein
VVVECVVDSSFGAIGMGLTTEVAVLLVLMRFSVAEGTRGVTTGLALEEEVVVAVEVVDEAVVE